MSTLETKVGKEHGRLGEGRGVLHETYQPDTKAKTVIELVARWGMVTGVNPIGRPKSRLYDLMTEGDVVVRAFKMVDLMFDELDKRGWMTTMDSLPEDSEEDS